MPQKQKKRKTTAKGRKVAMLVQDEPIDTQQVRRKVRRDADMPRMNDRDIFALCWVGEQQAASSKNLQELLARSDMRELLGSLAGKTPREVETLSAARIRHVIEDHWALAGMVHYETILGKRWVWPTRRALHAAGLPFSPHRPADIWLNHLHQVNRIRLHLERIYSSAGLPGHWESERWYERNKRKWKNWKKRDSGIYVPDEYRMWHTPDGIWIYRNERDTADSTATIEVEISAKRPATLWSILHELAIYAGTVWYFVEMDPKQGVFSGLIEIFEELEDRFKSRFYFYDLAEPGRLVYHYE